MRYSLVNGERSEAQPGLSGQCQACDRITIAKCGEVKIWHWAHSGKRMCDPWWENETEWHRNWKSYFPVNWQEIAQKDQNGEKHIADVKTDQGWVLEFQYSFLKPEERRARNAFYEKLIWVVNGTRCARDKTQFFKFINESNPVTTSPHMRKIYLDKCALLKEWKGNHAPVLFDFGEEILWCLLSASQNMWGYIVAFPRWEFIELHNKDAGQTKNFENCLNNLNTLANLISQKLSQEGERRIFQTPSVLARKPNSRRRF